MKKKHAVVFIGSWLTFMVMVCSCVSSQHNVIRQSKTEEEQAAITPWHALQKLKDGNTRFINGTMRTRDYVAQVATAEKQFPFAVVLNCMDSRGATEIIFDQGIGDIFVERLAGNVVNEDVLGGMEYATKIVMSKLIVVLGHTSCGAVKGACDNAELGNLTQLLDKIKPAVHMVQQQDPTLHCEDKNFIDQIAKQNVLNAIEKIKRESPVIMSLIDEDKIGLVGAINDISSGRVTFFEDHKLLPGAPEHEDVP